MFRLDGNKAAEIYKEVGEDYINLILAPESASAIRGLTSESDAKALYSNGRNIMQTALKAELKEKLGPRGIIIEDVLLKDLQLPVELSKAIELKAKAEQDAARMEFVLQKERQEAQRKAIEAQGIADFQRIVSEGISPELLQWKGVEATEKFADAVSNLSFCRLIQNKIESRFLKLKIIRERHVMNTDSFSTCLFLLIHSHQSQILRSSSWEMTGADYQ